MASHVTVKGEMVDLICRRVYGDESGFVERVLAANPGLADRGAVLPGGVVIELPEIAPQFAELPVIGLF